MAKLENLPGTRVDLIDGNTIQNTPSNTPTVVVIGTADSGPTGNLTRVTRLTDASKQFGKGGTLARGMYEAAQGGAQDIRLYRIGSSPAVLEGIIGGSVTVTTVAQDDSAGDDFNLLYSSTTGELTIRRVLDNVIVFYFDPSDPDAKIDLNQVAVEGTWDAGDGVDIDDGSGDPLLLSEVDTVEGTFTAGTDGTDPSRMELWEDLYDAYRLLRDQEVDIALPVDVYLDDANVTDLSEATVSGLWFGESNAYPTEGTPKDILGKVFVQEYEGINRFWWLLHWDRAGVTADTAVTAQIWPSGVGSASATTDANGTTLTYGDFHEVNFAWQLANFCYQISQNDRDCLGVIGVLPPNSYTLKDLASWVGEEPVVDADTGVITTNGTGLLGNKFMAGRLTSGDIPGLIIDGTDGLSNGGFIATETNSQNQEFLDEAQLKDDNDQLIDIGKYLSILSVQPILSNPVLSNYVSTGAGLYAGMVTTLPADSAPTNKVVPGAGLPFRISRLKIDKLAGKRYVHFHDNPTKGVVVSDAPTASRPDSDYNRLSTVRIVKAVTDSIRTAADRFLGEGLTGARMAALETTVERVLVNLQQSGFLQRFSMSVSATPEQQVLGQATVQLTLVPAFELRQLFVEISLASA